MPSSFWRITAWFILLAIAIATLGPINFRPVTGEPPQLERLVAYALMGAAFAFAYPRQIFVIGIGIIAVAGALELLQLVDPGRHGHFADFVAKGGGGLIGVSLVLIGRFVRHKSLVRRL
jgi:hypothetical protein